MPAHSPCHPQGKQMQTTFKSKHPATCRSARARPRRPPACLSTCHSSRACRARHAGPTYLNFMVDSRARQVRPSRPRQPLDALSPFMNGWRRASLGDRRLHAAR